MENLRTLKAELYELGCSLNLLVGNIRPSQSFEVQTKVFCDKRSASYSVQTVKFSVKFEYFSVRNLKSSRAQSYIKHC